MPTGKSNRRSPADDRLIQAAAEARRFADWLAAAGDPCRQSWRTFPSAEFRERFARLDAECRDLCAMPNTVRELAARLLPSIRDEVRSSPERAIALGIAIVSEIQRLADLLVFYATEAAERSGAEPCVQRPGTRRDVKPLARSATSRRSER